MDDVKKALQALHEALTNYPVSPQEQEDHQAVVIPTLRSRLQYVLTHEFSKAELVTLYDELGDLLD